MRPLIIVGIIIISLIAGKLFFSSLKEKEAVVKGPPQAGSSGGGPAQTVDYIVAGYSDANQSVFSTGSVIPNEEVNIQSEVSGRLVQLQWREGSYVKKGQLVAKLDDSDLQAQLKKIAYEESLADQIQARQKKLLDINAISKEEYEIATNNVNTLGVDKELLQVQLAKTQIRAPFNGRIGLKNISVGAYVTPSTVIGTLVQTNPVKIEFTIPEKYASMIHSGQQITFQRDGSPMNYTATVKATDPTVDANSRTLKVRALATNNGGELLPGMFVRVNLNLGTTQSIMVPSDAVVPVMDGMKVYVIRNGKATDTPIETGLRNEQSVQVVNGLALGDTVITSGIITLKNGAPVKGRKK